jgi:hypothetical protein
MPPTFKIATEILIMTDVIGVYAQVGSCSCQDVNVVGDQAFSISPVRRRFVVD